MSANKFTDEFKRDAVAQVDDRGYPVREVAERLGVSTKSIYTWQKQSLPQTGLGGGGNVIGREAVQPTILPVRLIVPMLERFIAKDRGAAKGRPGRAGDAE